MAIKALFKDKNFKNFTSKLINVYENRFLSIYVKFENKKIEKNK